MNYRVRNIVIAVMLAAVAAALTAVYVTNYKRDVQQGRDLVSVLVAKKDIPAGTLGADAAGSLVSKQLERRNVVPGAITSAGQIDQLVAAQPIFAGEQVTTRRFRSETQQGVQGELSGNLRALQVPGDANQLLTGTLKSGDKVDVVASIKFTVDQVAGTTSGGSTDRVASRAILRDLLVLRPCQPSESGSKLDHTGDCSVLLAVTDAQAQKLFFAMRNGDWSLALRPTRDPADSPESVETVESVLGDGLKADQLKQLVYGFGKGN
jgi:pilus assembly protein CpaB